MRSEEEWECRLQDAWRFRASFSRARVTLCIGGFNSRNYNNLSLVRQFFPGEKQPTTRVRTQTGVRIAGAGQVKRIAVPDVPARAPACRLLAVSALFIGIAFTSLRSLGAFTRLRAESDLDTRAI